MSPQRPALLLDEMFAPALAQQLRADGFDVVAVAGHEVLAAASDEEVLRWAAAHGRWVVTENVRDFEPLVRLAAQQGEPPPQMLYTSSRRFPRSRRNPAPLLDAFRRWLADPSAHCVSQTRAPWTWLT